LRPEEDIKEIRKRILQFNSGMVFMALMAPIYMVVNSIAIKNVEFPTQAMAGLGLGMSSISILFFSIGASF
jgi:hypothetical protein